MLRAHDNKQISMEFVSIEELVPSDHLLRKIDRVMDFEFAFDERVLGGGDFVEKLSGLEPLKEGLAPRLDLGTLARRVAEHFEIGIDELVERGRYPQRVAACDLFCYVAVRILGYSGVQAGELLGLQRAAVSHAVRRGKVLAGQGGWRVESILGRFNS